MARTNLATVLQDFDRYGDDVAVVQRRGYRREVWKYWELRAATLRICGFLASQGIGTGDRVLLWGRDSAEWIAAFWGILARGAVAVPVDAGSAPEFALHVRRECAARLAFVDRQKAALLPHCNTLVLEELRATADGVSLEDGRAAMDFSVGPGTIAQILFTSGTTTEPRGVVLTHGNFLANLDPLERGIEPYRKWERWFHPLRFVTLVPLSHVFGQFMGLLVPPLLGATLVFEPSANPAEIIRTIKRERATALIAVPRMLDTLRNGLLRELEARGWSGWFAAAYVATSGRPFLRRAWHFRRIHRKFGWKLWAFISGGAALSPETEEFFRRLGYAAVQGYGMTETASLISLNHPFRAAPGSVGKVLPGREFRLAEDGEIMVRGGNVAVGYLEGGIARPLTEDGWVRTGDLGELDAEGNLRFRGRKKNVIVTPAGLNIYPEDVEAALHRQPAVRDCAVIPLERGGNAEPCAVLLLEGANETVARAAIEAANASLAEYQRMRQWLVWPEADFPRTPTGKPRLGLIAARVPGLLGGKLPSASPSPLDDILARFQRPSVIPSEVRCRDSGGVHWTPETEARNLSSPRQRLEQTLSLSSLERVELMSALEQRFHVELNETSFAEAKTVADVERLLSERFEAGRKAPAWRGDYVYPRWTQSEPVRWLRLAVYYALVWPATQILAHPRIVGRGNLRGVRGPALIVSNHVTRRADIGLVLAALPLRFRHRLATAMGGQTLQNMRYPPGDWFFAKRWAYQLGYWLVTALFSVFPLPQQSGFRESFRFAGESVDRGYSVLVFPEGEVTNDGKMAPFRSGIGLLAENLCVPIVPMRLDGVWGMKRERRRLAHPSEITVRIGVAVTFPAGTPAEEIARELESRVKSL